VGYPADFLKYVIHIKRFRTLFLELSLKGPMSSQTLEALVLAQQQQIATLEARLSQIASNKVNKRIVHAEFKDDVLYIRFYNFRNRRFIHIYIVYSKHDLPVPLSMEDTKKHTYRCVRIVKHPDRDSANATYEISRPRALSPLLFTIRAQLLCGGFINFNLEYNTDRGRQGGFLMLECKTFKTINLVNLCDHDLFAIGDLDHAAHYDLSDEASQRIRGVLEQAVDAWGIERIS